MKKLIYGKGTNNYSGTVSYMNNGKTKMKLFYRAWANMLERCYSDEFHQTRPTYIGCTVCDKWLSLTNFKAWHDVNYIEGYHLDKDIIKIGNKVYSPENCRYVPNKLNTLLCDKAANRGEYPKGVSFSKDNYTKSYLAQIRYNGKQIHIGRFKTVKTAFIAYANAKHKIILESAREQTDIAIREGLVNHAKALLNQAEGF